ncbi:MAG: TonB-dependent receptor [Pseudomonadales bacterium]|jgi:outer membrane receptor protein involved in Fe transport|nr:TonB-dependent receptor [Pseudomonadales bacterium]
MVAKITKTAAKQRLGQFSIPALTALISSVTASAVLAQELEEIRVTGSRIQRDIGFESPTPVTVLEMGELQALDPGLGVSQQLANLPQFFNNVSSDSIAGRVGGDVGQSQLNMRGMGGERTLVLLDGLRVVPSDSRSSVSVDYLPSPLILRTDIVTGGASAAYGSGALTGVTNFLIDRKFTGFKYSARGGLNEFNGDGQNYRLTAAWGENFLSDDRLHLVGSIELRNNREFRRGRPDAFEVEWDEFQGYVTNPEWTAWREANPTAPASSAPVPLRLTKPNITSTAFTATGLIRQPGFTYDRYMFTENGNGVQPFQNCGFVSLPGAAGTQQNMSCQSGDYQYQLFRKGRYIEDRARLGVDLQTGFLGADFKLTDTTTLWGHVLYGRTKNTSPPTQTGQHEGVSFLTVYSGNPFLPPEVQQAMTAQNRASIRVDQNGFSDTPWGYQERPVVTNYMYSLTGGFDTTLGGDWDLRGSYTTGYAKKHSVLNNWERNDRFFMAHDAVRDPETGNIVCRIQLVARDFQRQGRNLEAELHEWAQKNTSVYRTDGLVSYDAAVPLEYPFAVDSIDNTIRDCVPVNMFGKGNQSEAAMQYIFSSRNKTADSIQKQQFAEIVASGTVYKDWYAGAISGAIGATYRKESIDQHVIDQAIDVLGPPYNVTLADGTVVMRGIPPQIQGGGANLHRFSSQPSYGGGFDVTEIFAETIIPLFKASNGPQYAELNLAARDADYSRAGKVMVWKAGLSFRVLEDLRLRGTYSHDMREGSFRELFTQQGGGGTPTDPEPTRETPTSPLVANRSYLISSLSGGNPNIEPEQANTTALGFVYQPSFLKGFQFSLDRYIVKLDPSIVQFTVQQIVDQCYQSGTFCERIDRDPATNMISMIRNVFVNSDRARVSGWDTEISYRFDPDFLNEWTESMNLRLVGGYMDENSITPLGGITIERAGQADMPKAMLTFMGSYTFGKASINLVQTWTGSTKRNNTWVEGVDVDSNKVPSWHNTNLGFAYRGDSKQLGSWTASFNVTNLFNRAPIQRGLTTVGDEIGRRYSVGFDVAF